MIYSVIVCFEMSPMSFWLIDGSVNHIEVRIFMLVFTWVDVDLVRQTFLSIWINMMAKWCLCACITKTYKIWCIWHRQVRVTPVYTYQLVNVNACFISTCVLCHWHECNKVQLISTSYRSQYRTNDFFILFFQVIRTLCLTSPIWKRC